MKRGLIVLAVGVCAALAVWAYSLAGRAREATSELRHIQAQMKQERQTIEILKAEWAYLNRPERLRALVDLNFEALGLMSITARNYGDAASVPYASVDAVDSFPEVDLNNIEAILADIAKNSGEQYP